MRILLILFPLLSWGVIPQLEMDKLGKQYLDANQTTVKSTTYNNKKYYIVHSVEEKIFPDDTLEEEKIYLKAGIQHALYQYMKRQYPKIVSLQLSGLLHDTFWEDTHFYHHIAQIETDNLQPIYEKSSSGFTIKNDIHDIQQEKIKILERESNKDPSNVKLLNALGKLYKELGDVEGYASVSERIMDAKMAI